MDQLDLPLSDEIAAGGTSTGDRRSVLALQAALARRGEFTCLEIGSRHATQGIDPAELKADLCFVDAEHTDDAALQAARFGRRVVRDRGVIVFHDRTLIAGGIQRFLGELSHYRAYPLAHDLFVVEINVPSLLPDPQVTAQVPRRLWLIVDRLRAARLAIRLTVFGRNVQVACGSTALALAAPRRARRRQPEARPSGTGLFEIYSFVNDNVLYEQMQRSFVAAGFSRDAFVRLSDSNEDPYGAITRIGRESTARYPILCHQDLLAVPGVGAPELVAALEELDELDPAWIVAGNAGVMRSGRVLVRLADPDGGSTGEPLPLPVATLDELFLVFNGQKRPRCSAGLSGFHLYGSDVCLNALSSGGSAYVIDFPVRHLGQGAMTTFDSVKSRFVEAWGEHHRFLYVLTTVDTIFVSRSKALRRLFGSSRAISVVNQCRQRLDGRPLRRFDRLLTRQVRKRHRQAGS